MAYLEFKYVRIAGIAAGVPKNIQKNDDGVVHSDNYDAAAYVETTGVIERRIDETSTTSDLSLAATERLLADLGWERGSIDALLFVSQTADYFLPATACILQDKLGLSKECFAADISLGCSGWVYGLSMAASMVSAQNMKRVLLLAGDAKRRAPSNDPLFGFAGTATAIEFEEGNKGLQFHFGTDGSGYDAIIVPDGGSRNQITAKSLIAEKVDGNMLTPLNSRMKGMDVFAFGITTAPKSVKRLAEHFGFDYLGADYYVFHQANLKMNETIRKKLKLEQERVPYSMPYFGNTSSASIPITIVTQLKGKFEDKPTKFICCGFGVGLSWGTVAFETNNIVVSKLVEI